MGEEACLGGVSDGAPAEVVILGRCGGRVCENSPWPWLFGPNFRQRHLQVVELQSSVAGICTFRYNPVSGPAYSADVVIGAIHWNTAEPVLITEEMVSRMKEGSILIDVSIDQGGCFETSEITTLENPTFIKHGVIRSCVPTPSQVSRTASDAIGNYYAITR